MAELKTTPNDGDVAAFLEGVENDRRRRDAIAVCSLMTDITGDKPRMWGDSIVGFGSYKYRPRSAAADREWFKTGFSPRKQSLTLYIMDGFSEYEELLSQLGPHSTGRACLYVRDLEKVDGEILEKLIRQSVKHVEKRLTG